jgi:hypothetical protein
MIGFINNFFYNLLITISYSAIYSLPSSQINRRRSILRVFRCTPSILILSCTLVLCPLIIPQDGPHGKYVSHVIKNACLLVRYLALDFLLLLRAYFRNVFTEPFPTNGHMRHNMEVNCQLKASAALSPPKEPLAPIGEQAGWDPGTV